MTVAHTRNAPTADVVVVGGGGSGLFAAISTAERGLRTILIEKAPRLGGSTGMSIGSIAAAGTSLQAANGISDSNELFRADLRRMNGDLDRRGNALLREVLVAGAADTVERLRSLGVQFMGPVEMHGYSVRRLHQVVPNSRAYVGALRREATRNGVDIRLGTRATALLRNAGGRVIGVRAGEDLLARHAVILASGDYSANPDLIRKYTPSAVGLPAVNNNCTGDGHTMAMEIGAAFRLIADTTEGMRFTPAPGVDVARALPSGALMSRLTRIAIERMPRGILAWFARRVLTTWVKPEQYLFDQGAIMVNARGERFTNELDRSVSALGTQPGNLCYIVMDSVVADRFRRGGRPISTFPGIAYAYLEDYLSLRPDVTHVAGTPEDLARALRFDPATFSRNLAKYNAAVAAGEDGAFHRHPVGPPLQRAPFVAMGPLLGCVTSTEGGLAVNESCQVLDTAGAPIAGLYAAGNVGQDALLLRGHGTHLAWAMTSGRVAGAAAAHEAPQGDLEVVESG